MRRASLGLGLGLGPSLAGIGEGELLAHWAPSDSTTLFQDTAGATPVTATGQQVARVEDQDGTAHATQTTVANRPTIPAAGYRLRTDFSNDVITTPALPQAGVLPAVVNTPYGHYTTQVAGGLIFHLPLNDALDIRVYSHLTPEQLAALGAVYANTRVFLVTLSPDTTIINLEIVGSTPTKDVVFVGANGATVTKAVPSGVLTSYNVSGDGLTAPVAVVFPSDYIGDTGLTTLTYNNNNLAGSLPDISRNTELQVFGCQLCRFTGTVPDLSRNTKLTNYNVGSNQLTGRLPDLSSNTLLKYAFFYINQFTGSIPDLSNNTVLEAFYCQANQLTGPIPDLSNNIALAFFNCRTNQLTGNIPDLSNNTALTEFYCHTNQITGYVGGTVSATLGRFEAQNNLLTQAAVDALLAAFVAANKTTGTRILNLGGTGNATPSATGLADKATLVSRGWTVTTN